MKRMVCCIVAWSCVAGWAQSDGKSAAPGLTVVQDAPKAVPKSAGTGKFELTLEPLRDRLVLTPRQQSPWNAFADKVGAYTEVFYRERPVLASQESTAAHQVSRLVDNMQNRLAALEEVELATKSLYASLGPDQQRTANQLLIAAIPTFAAVEVNPSGEARKRKGPVPQGARGHRGGMGGEGMGGGGGG